MKKRQTKKKKNDSASKKDGKGGGSAGGDDGDESDGYEFFIVSYDNKVGGKKDHLLPFYFPRYDLKRAFDKRAL